MLQAYPTKNGTGVLIMGDYGDLMSMYDTVHHFASTLEETKKIQKAYSQLLMNFAYEIRKAYSGLRTIDKLKFYGDVDYVKYYGFQIVWTDILVFISVLRINAGFTQSDKLHQANLYMLEGIIEKALYEYDAAGAHVIKDFIGQQINVSNEYTFIIYQALHIRFVTERRGKSRFRSIPNLLRSYFLSSSPEYKEIIASFQKSADEQKCKITDLEFDSFPEIVW